MKLSFYMIRHGLSCGNIIYHPDINLVPLNSFYRDPYLTEKGVEQSVKCSKYIETKLPKMDIVLSSSLIRAIETGLCMFPNNIIEITPYICESVKTLENMPHNYKIQSKRLQEKVKSNERVKHCVHQKGLHESNLKNFIMYLLENYNVIDKEIAIVTHSNFMMKILGVKERMRNNSIFKVVVDTETCLIEDYTMIFSGYTLPDTASLRMSFR